MLTTLLQLHLVSSMSSRRVRVIRRHQPLITFRIPFEVQSLPPPPAITLRQNLEGVLTKSNRKPPSHCHPVFVPMPVASKNAPPKSSNDPAPGARQTAIAGGNGVIGADDSESELSDIDSLSDAPDSVQQAATSFTPKIPKPPGEAGRPKSGGFNLEETLCWPKEYFNAVQVRPFN